MFIFPLENNHLLTRFGTYISKNQVGLRWEEGGGGYAIYLDDACGNLYGALRVYDTSRISFTHSGITGEWTSWTFSH